MLGLDMPCVEVQPPVAHPSLELLVNCDGSVSMRSPLVMPL